MDLRDIMLIFVATIASEQQKRTSMIVKHQHGKMVCLLLVATTLLLQACNPAARKGWELVWHDEFNGHQLSDEWTRIPRFPNP